MGTKPPLLDPPAAAAKLNISERHLRSLTQERRIPFHKVGRLNRYDPDELDAWLDQNHVQAEA